MIGTYTMFAYCMLIFKFIINKKTTIKWNENEPQAQNHKMIL